MSIYPNAIDGYEQIPLIIDGVTRVDAISVNALREAILNIEEELGVLPSSEDYNTVAERLDALSLLDPSDLVDLEARVTELEATVIILQDQITSNDVDIVDLQNQIDNIDTDTSLQEAYDTGQSIVLSNTLGDLDINLNTSANFDIRDNLSASIFALANTGQATFTGNVDVAGGVDIIADSQFLRIGASNDLEMSHNGTNSVVTSITGDLIIDNTSATGSTINRLGTDTSATSFEVQNNSLAVLFDVLGDGNARIPNDTGNLYFGASNDLGLTHNGTNSVVTNTTGDLIMDNTAATGSTINRLGTDTSATSFEVQNDSLAILFDVLGDGNARIPNDTGNLYFGTSNDLGLTHNGTNSVVTSATGDLIIDNTAATGSTINRLGTDTSATSFEVQNNSLAVLFDVLGDGNARIPNDTGNLYFGASNDLGLTHNGTNSVITSITGDLIIDNTVATGSTINRLGTDTSATSFEVQNNSLAVLFDVLGDGSVRIPNDTGNLYLGASNDLGIIHNGTNSVVTSITGDLIIDNTAATGSTISRLGTDTTATSFEVQNNSTGVLFSVDGSGEVRTYGGLLMDEIATPSAAATDTGYIYTKADGTDTELFFYSDLNGTDTEVQITKDGALNISVEEVIRTYAQGGSLAAGDVVYQSSTVDNRVELADADDSTAIPPIGVVEEVVDGSTVNVIHSGGVATNFIGLTRGDQYWLDTTAGDVTNVRPTINAYLVGVALSSTEMLIMTDGKEAFVQSDADGIEVFASGSIGTGGSTTSDSDVRNFREIDWVIDVTSVTTAVQVDVLVEYSDQSTPTRYANITSESITSGLASQEDYTAQYDIGSESTPFQIALTMPVRGRNMRITASVDAGSITASINAYRRI